MLLLNGKSDDAGRVMIELLGTYTTENASQAREEAQRCIIACLAGCNVDFNTGVYILIYIIPTSLE